MTECSFPVSLQSSEVTQQVKVISTIICEGYKEQAPYCLWVCLYISCSLEVHSECLERYGSMELAASIGIFLLVVAALNLAGGHTIIINGKVSFSHVL